MSKHPALCVVLVAAVCTPSYAELYKYTDEKGNIHITDNLDAVPDGQPPRRPADADDQHRAADRTGDASKRPAGVSGKKAAPSARITSGPSTTPHEKNDMSAHLNVQISPDPSSADASKLPPEYKEQFKEVMNSSSIPPEGATTSCSEFKAGLNKDIDKIEQTCRDLAAEKKKGELGMLAKAKGIWTLKSIGWVAYRMMTGPEQCVKEFEKENSARFDAMTKEIDALTAEAGGK